VGHFDPEANGTCDLSHTFEGELQEYSIESQNKTGLAKEMNMNCYFFYLCLVLSDRQSHSMAIMGLPSVPSCHWPGGPTAQAADGQPIWPCHVTASHSTPNKSKKITIHVHFI